MCRWLHDPCASLTILSGLCICGGPHPILNIKGSAVHQPPRVPSSSWGSLCLIHSRSPSPSSSSPWCQLCISQILVTSTATLRVPAFSLIFFPLLCLPLPIIVFVSGQFYTSWLWRKEECFVNLVSIRVTRAHECHKVVFSGATSWGQDVSYIIRISWCFFLFFWIFSSLDCPFFNAKDLFLNSFLATS